MLLCRHTVGHNLLWKYPSFGSDSMAPVCLVVAKQRSPQRRIRARGCKHSANNGTRGCQPAAESGSGWRSESSQHCQDSILFFDAAFALYCRSVLVGDAYVYVGADSSPQGGFQLVFLVQAHFLAADSHAERCTIFDAVRCLAESMDNSGSEAHCVGERQ